MAISAPTAAAQTLGNDLARALLFQSSAPMEQNTIRNKILELLEAQTEGKTICPSDVARALDSKHFRKLMPDVRTAAHSLVDEHSIDVTQRGTVVDVRTARGPVRLRLRR